MTALLAAVNMTVGYGPVSIVRDLDLTVNEGEIVALLGPNGAGKTTTMLALCGELTPSAGEVWWKGSPTKSPLYQRARDGLAVITEERSVFMSLTVAENLRLGGADENALDNFPALRPLLGRKAGLLSGGEQQILTVARALARRPKVILADELSMGLAPLIVKGLLSTLRTAADSGVGVLIVEQHIRSVLGIADRVYVLRQGRVQFSGTAAEAREKITDIEASYLAGGGDEESSPE